METLEELVDLTEEFGYEHERFWDELVLYAGFLLQAHETLFPQYRDPHFLGTATEYNNTRAHDFFSFWEFKARDLRTQSQVGRYYIADKLPDVCGSCFLSFELCVSGRYRLGCAECKGEKMGLAAERSMNLHRYCMYGSINDAVLAQLIYKYYSPNGDRSWVLKPYNPLLHS